MTRFDCASRMVLFLVSLGAFTPLARAAESYDNCTGFITSLPAIISTQGTWCLKQDLATAISSGNAITINTNNVTIDCNNFKLGGLAAGVGTQANGIYANNRQNLIVRHCNIRGFLVGVDFTGSGGGGHAVEDNRFDGNTGSGINVVGDGSVVQRNRVFDTGGSTVQAYAVGIDADYSADVLDNTVSGVVASTGGDGDAYGIFTNQSSNGSVRGNRVRGLLSDGAGTAWGDYNSVSDRIVVQDNEFVGPGFVAVHCLGSNGSLRNNVISGFAFATDNCLSSGNTVIP